MRIGIIQASSQCEKNAMIYNTVRKVANQHEVINFGCFEEEVDTFSYIEIALEIGLLIASGAVDFIITGCSSGQGMMIACNSLPNLICGYCPTPQDAFLFARINDGNVVSLPLGLNFGWSGEINLKHTIEALFDGPFGSGYPEKDAERKMKDTKLLKSMNAISKKDILSVMEELEDELVKKALKRENVVQYIIGNSQNEPLVEWIKRKQ